MNRMALLARLHLIKNGDTKFTEKLDEIFESEGIKAKRLSFASPNLNAYAEQFVQTVQNECLDHFVTFGERHLELLLRNKRTIGRYVLYYRASSYSCEPILAPESSNPRYTH